VSGYGAKWTLVFAARYAMTLVCLEVASVTSRGRLNPGCCIVIVTVLAGHV